MPNESTLQLSSVEALLVGVDFSPQIHDTDTIVSSNLRGATEIKILDSEGVDKTGDMLDAGSFNIVGNIVQGLIHDCERYNTYKMYFRAAISVGNYLEKYITIECS